GGSSTLPQKRNPVDAVEAIAAARLALGVVPVVLGSMIQEHERAIGSWQAEWVAVPDLFSYVAGALERTRAAVAALEVDPERMRANLEQTGGLLMAEALSLAIARRTGKERAHQLVQALTKRAIAQGIDLRTAALADEDVRAALDALEVDRALDPASYLGSADALIDRALARYREVCS
ncbi:MAG: 3-carboxy-cis,cis-muconate cycloisomerase, partial [Chloroflexi bacterium]|nr:3-carboxy-cis,cis-muconate cycloisomerase [Chloroflexota bacterium]